MRSFTVVYNTNFSVDSPECAFKQKTLSVTSACQGSQNTHKRFLTSDLVFRCVFSVDDLRCGMNPSFWPLCGTDEESDVSIFFPFDVELPG